MNIFLSRDSFELLRESGKDGESWKVMLIEEGMSKNGKFYPGEVLKKAAPLFEKAKAFFYQFKGKHFDHLPIKIENLRPEGFPRQLAGWYSNVKFEEFNVDGEKKKGLTATLHIHDGAKWLREMLKDAWKHGMKRILGLSINAEGTPVTKFIDGRNIEVVSAINRVLGVDLVTHPAAGGKLLRLLASNQGGESMNWIVELMKKLRPDLLESVNVEELTESQLQEILEKALQEADAAQKKAIEEAKIKAQDEKKKKEEEEKAKKKKEEEEKKKKEEKEAAELTAALKTADSATKELLETSMEEIEKHKKFQEADGKATLTQAIKLIREKSYAPALNVLQKWLSKYPAADGNKKEYPAKEVEELKKKLQDIEFKNELAECARLLDEELKDSKLPKVVREKIKKNFKDKKVKKEEIEEAIKSEKEVLAKLSESGDVNLMDLDNDDIHLGSSANERLQASLDLTINSNIEEEEKSKYESIDAWQSIREAYVKITGDVTISGRIPESRLREATTSDFSYMLGTAINRRLARDYKLRPAEWKEIADIVPLKDFRQKEIIRWGGIANLETVSEGDSSTYNYPNIAFPADVEATYTPETRGGIVTITRRMIINDDLRSLQKIPAKLSRAGANSLNQFVFDLMMGYTGGTINSDTIYDDLALYVAAHFNYATAALDYDSYAAGAEALQEQRETGYEADLADDPLNSTDGNFDVDSTTIAAFFHEGDYVIMDSEIIGPITDVTSATITAARGAYGTTAATHVADTTVKIITNDLNLEPGHLWVPSNLRAMGNSIINNDKQDDTLANKNQWKGSAKLHVMPRGVMRGDTAKWYLTAKKEDIEMIEIGFIGGREIPEILVQDAPGVGNVFVRDNIRYKIRHEYGGAIVDEKGFYSGQASA